MKTKLNYFVFNKSSDYERGFAEGMEVKGGSISVSENYSSDRRRFFSGVLNSYESDMDWHRMTFSLENPAQNAFKLSIYAANDINIEFEGQMLNIKTIISSNEFKAEEKLELMQPFLVKQALGAEDLLLHEVRGQYLWFVFEVFMLNDEPVTLKDIMVMLPRQSWIDYLPGIYRSSDLKDSFLERYLAIFQTLYEDLNFKIENISDLFDINCEGKEFLEWLSEWFDICDSYIWPQEKLRMLLSNAVDLYLRRGTPQSISDIVELFTGEKPYLIESYKIEKYKDTDEYKSTLVPLYTNNPFVFTVLVKEKYIKTVREYNILLRIIGEMMPVRSELKLVSLKPYIFLNKYSYLGINSSLGKYRSITLDGSAQLPMSTIGSN